MHTSPVIRAHWAMLDCLFDEIFLGQHSDTLHEKEMLEELFRYFASHDPRFNAVGLVWNAKGYVEYRGYRAEGAIAAFLGLPTTARGDATHVAIKAIYKVFTSLLDFRIWLRWHVQKMYGYDRMDRDLWADYPRDFPDITSEISDLEKI